MWVVDVTICSDDRPTFGVVAQCHVSYDMLFERAALMLGVDVTVGLDDRPTLVLWYQWQKRAFCAANALQMHRKWSACFL